ncbi:hypothetical protein A2954_01470 [Candidatus Roizmanbacteria bacterium RIFCSPLOWO2_01_FULL_37_12]|uniref:O-antigen ligase-related domain-containing protein n=1 Tax=Candidatus Roizmanbacteria bacterium RIFCSPLOWO2_01_FULL_37_12 TaxID=1802056 RepID=A0A1F7I8W0_9BACT|nr:MAG: hypothetical protein A2954_01470 [Candidatus Roizmanbacteria bacterium RIFCSPLOWO2_01_FULL_37_12]
MFISLVRFKLLRLKENFKEFFVVYVFLFYLFISFLIGAADYKPFENFIGFLYFVRLTLYWIYWIYLIYWINKHKNNKKILEKSLLILIILTAIYSIIQYFFYPDLRNLIYAGWDPHLYRLFGTFFDTSVAGAIYGLIFFALYLRGMDLVKNRWLLIALLSVNFILVVLTFSRSLYLAFITCLVLHSILKKFWKRMVIFLVVFTFLLLVVPKPFGEGVNLGRMFSVRSRLDDYRAAIKIWRRSPLLGIGYNRIRYEKIRINIIEGFGSDLTHSGASFHSSFSIILVTGGVIGLVLFIFVLLRLSMINEFSRYLVIFLSLMSLSDNILLHPFIIFLFLSLTALYRVSPSRKSI